MSRARGFATDAIVLRVIEFGETSQVVHIATPDHGFVATLAKGAHSSRGAFQGGVPLGVLGVAEVAPRRGELQLLRSFRVTDGLAGLRDALPRFEAGTRILGLLRELEKPDLAAPALFLAGASALKAVATSSPDAAELWEQVFEARALAASGHRPHLATCIACGEELGAAAVFSPAAGGTVHDRCHGGGARLRLAPEVLAALRRLYAARLPEIAAEPPSPRELRGVRAVHDLFLAWVLGREAREPSALRRRGALRPLGRAFEAP
jgi:DNA repair protein RecO (recombination protein O)